MVDANKYEADHFSRNLFKLSLSLSQIRRNWLLWDMKYAYIKNVFCVVCVYMVWAAVGVVVDLVLC